MKKLNILPANPESEKKGRFPSWLHRNLPKGGALFETTSLLKDKRLPTVCEEAKCPNRFECYSKKTATFLALGKECTRNCGFCDIDFSKTPKAPEEDEPMRIAESAKAMGLKHIVVTMVARDDLPLGGAPWIANIIHTLRLECPQMTVEVLTSDFEGNEEALCSILEAKPDVFNHNIETVRALSPRVRHKASYDRTLKVLSFVKQSQKIPMVKSGLMVGLGETPFEVEETLKDLHAAGCDIVTIGQYLQPNHRKLLVKEFIHPQQFEQYAAFGKKIGLKHVYAGPFVRSSYNAHAFLD